MATTGTTTSTSDFGGLNDAMKNVYEKAFDNNIEKEQEVLDVFKKASFDTFDGPDGKGVYMNHIFTSGGGFASGTEDDYLPTPTLPVQKQSYLTIKKHTLVSELSGQALRRVLKGPAAFATWADEELPRKAQIGAWHLDRQALGTGTGIAFRVADGSPDTTLGIVTEAWMRVFPKPSFRSAATVRFERFSQGLEATRLLAQSGLYPTNCRLLDGPEAMVSGSGPGDSSLLLLAFESADHPLQAWMARALELVSDHGGRYDSAAVARSMSDEGSSEHRTGAAGAWR
jgi:hypothetical protein